MSTACYNLYRIKKEETILAKNVSREYFLVCNRKRNRNRRIWPESRGMNLKIVLSIRRWFKLTFFWEIIYGYRASNILTNKHKTENSFGVVIWNEIFEKSSDYTKLGKDYLLSTWYLLFWKRIDEQKLIFNNTTAVY